MALGTASIVPLGVGDYPAYAPLIIASPNRFIILALSPGVEFISSEHRKGMGSPEVGREPIKAVEPVALGQFLELAGLIDEFILFNHA